MYITVLGIKHKTFIFKIIKLDSFINCSDKSIFVMKTQIIL